MIDKTVFKDKKAVYYTLGCKLNFSETATIERQLQDAGIRTAKRGEVADICVVNSCAVTQEAEKKQFPALQADSLPAEPEVYLKKKVKKKFTQSLCLGDFTC